MKYIKRLIFLPFILIVCMSMTSSTSSVGDLMSVEEVFKIHKNTKEYVIVSARKKSDYTKVHIPNAINIEVKALHKSGNIKGLIKKSTDLAKVFGNKGVVPTKTVIIYDGGDYKGAGRLYWALKYIGFSKVKILNGGIKAWKTAKKKLTKTAVKPKKGTFTPKVKGVNVTTSYVEKNKDKSTVVLVDVRSPEEFNGTKGETPRKGHIPGAINFNYNKVYGSNGKILSKASLKSKFDAAGITSSKEVILYCETSVRAGIVFMVLKTIMKYSKVKVYDGALWYWQSNADRPVEK